MLLAQLIPHLGRPAQKILSAATILRLKKAEALGTKEILRVQTKEQMQTATGEITQWTRAVATTFPTMIVGIFN